MTFPRSRIAPSGRASCLQCGQKIAAGALKIEVERSLQTPGGTRLVASSLHPACVKPFLQTDPFPGGLSAFALAVSAHGEHPVPELQGHLPANAALPRGDNQALNGLLSLTENHEPPPAQKPVHPAEKVVEFIQAHRWHNGGSHRIDSRALSLHPPAVGDALIAGLPPDQRDEMRVELMGGIHSALFGSPTWQKGRERIEELARQVEGLTGHQLQSALHSGWAAASPEPCRRDLIARAPEASRYEAAWHLVQNAMRPGQAFDASQFDLLTEGLDGGEHDGRGLVHSAALLGSGPLLERFRHDVNRPLGTIREPLQVWNFGPNSDGDRVVTELKLTAGERPLDVVVRILALLREERAKLNTPLEPSARAKRQLARYGNNGEVERWNAEREALKPQVDAQIETYMRARAKLIELGATARHAPPPAREDARPGEGAAEVELPWLLDHLRHCGDDVFDEALVFQRAFARGDEVVVEYRSASGAEPATTAIPWPPPRSASDPGVMQLIHAIADAR